MYKALTIAGSDTSGGAGMEADLKTFQEMGVYGMTALTVIVAQNPRAAWAHELYPLDLQLIEKQLITVCEGIGADAMKTGMLGSAELVELVARTIDKYALRNVVIDPVMVCKGVDAIMVPEAAAAIKQLLVKRADVLTPNLLEAAYLTDLPSITTVAQMREAAGRLVELGAKTVVLKAGDRLTGEDAGGMAIDIAYDGKQFTEHRHAKIEGGFNHGAGCTFSAGITACLAKGMDIAAALEATEKFIAAALRGSFRLNAWSGATRHCAWRE